MVCWDEKRDHFTPDQIEILFLWKENGAIHSFIHSFLSFLIMLANRSIVERTDEIPLCLCANNKSLPITVLEERNRFGEFYGFFSRKTNLILKATILLFDRTLLIDHYCLTSSGSTSIFASFVEENLLITHMMCACATFNNFDARIVLTQRATPS